MKFHLNCVFRTLHKFEKNTKKDELTFSLGYNSGSLQAVDKGVYIQHLIYCAFLYLYYIRNPDPDVCCCLYTVRSVMTVRVRSSEGFIMSNIRCTSSACYGEDGFWCSPAWTASKTSLSGL